jgi:GNAT superfamily N-acetyltransferase
MCKTLSDDCGPVATYYRDERKGVVHADLFQPEPGVSLERAATAALAQLRGMRIAGDEALGRALIAAGGMPRRHGHLMSHDLAQRPHWHEPAGYRLTDVDRAAVDLVDAFRAAFPPGHVDHRDETPTRALEELEGHLSGRTFGPLLRGSGLAVAADGRVVGAIILGVLPGDPPLNGPWLMEVFRHPDHRGVGRALVERALALTDGPALGLMVTEGNPARRLYEALGFRVVKSLLVVQI